ncbi:MULTISPECIES: TetR/AcrR family transcriptional regulator [unclassified Novosphingobium]|uniref:TetR/AcrR family transcriptional regulator n=1 Tax=unclassified Novosphingobium TaxID=2644732 RepID=UPI00135CC9D9|nr:MULTISPECIES: TetR/AcrR family transcriptional regulator [unclassified Novosphingobium]
MTANLISGRGRPRGFDTEQALATGEALFHEKGYDGVGLAALTSALGIKPPSFYAAFGSKAAFFERVLQRYSSAATPIEDLFVPGRPPIDALAQLLLGSARDYAADPGRRGCLVLEAARSSTDAEICQLARTAAQHPRTAIRGFLMQSHPDAADGVTDMVIATMSGMSAAAREGWDEERLSRVARIALMGIAAELGD